MNIKHILIVLGEPYSTFSEILGKYFKKSKKLKKKVILIGNFELLKKQLKRLNYLFPINEVSRIEEAKAKVVNLINIDYNFSKTFDNNSVNYNNYIEKSFDLSLKILKKYKNNSVLINGPISKKSFLKKKFLGITEYLSKKTYSNNEVMLIYN